MALTKINLKKIAALLNKKLASYPTKKDLDVKLSAYPTKKDLVKELRIYATRFDLQDLKTEIEEKIKNLPTKDEFFKAMDEVMGELKTIREEQQLQSYHSSDQGERLEKLEKIHPGYQHL